MLISMDGLAKMDWTSPSAGRTISMRSPTPTSASPNASFTRQPGPHQDAPYAVAYPDYTRTRILITLPGKGAGFLLRGGADVDQTVAGVEYRRHSKIDNGVASIEITDRSVKSEFPASEADADGDTPLREMARLDVKWCAPSPTATSAPPSPSGTWPRHGAHHRPGLRQSGARGGPAAGRLRLRHRRLRQRRAAGSEHGAMGLFPRRRPSGQGPERSWPWPDLNKAVGMTPADADLLMTRAELYVRMGDVAKADVDFDAAAKLSASRTTPPMSCSAPTPMPM